MGGAGGRERERGVRVENKREERECRGWGSIRGRVEEERIKREGEVMKTGAMEMESLLIFRTIFLVCLFTHVCICATLQLSVFLFDSEMHR